MNIFLCFFFFLILERYKSILKINLFLYFYLCSCSWTCFCHFCIYIFISTLHNHIYKSFNILTHSLMHKYIWEELVKDTLSIGSLMLLKLGPRGRDLQESDGINNENHDEVVLLSNIILFTESMEPDLATLHQPN
jgi:hypothetical protein